jgi:hypothetical protein
MGLGKSITMKAAVKPENVSEPCSDEKKDLLL